MQNERDMILKMLESGKITADEATKLLSAIEKNNKEEEKSSNEEYEKAKTSSKDSQKSDGPFSSLANFVKNTVTTALSTASSSVDAAMSTIKNNMDSKKHLVYEKDLDGLKLLDIKNIDGDIKIISGENSIPSLKIYAYYDDYDMEAKKEVDSLIKDKLHIDYNDGKLVLNSESARRSITINVFKSREIYSNGYSTDILIELPLNYRLENIHLKSSYADLKLDGIQFDFAKLKTSNGDIKLFDIKGDNFNLITSNGDLIVNDSTFAKGYLTSSHGDIKIHSDDFKEVEASTSLGDIKLRDIYGTPSKIDLKTSMGDIKLDLSDIKTDQSINVQTSMPGSVNVADRFILKNPSKHSAVGYTNTKFKITTEINAQTSMGDVEVR